MCVVPDMWKDTPNEELVIKDMTDPKTGEKYPYEDRRQELVFIGVKLNHEAIQSTLDQCLLTDEEMELKPEIWLDKWEDEDKIKLAFVDEDEEEDEVRKDTIIHFILSIVAQGLSNEFYHILQRIPLKGTVLLQRKISEPSNDSKRLSKWGHVQN